MDDVEEGLPVGGPTPAVVGVRHRVGQVSASRQVSKAEFVHLVAGHIDRVRQAGSVRADQLHTHLDVRRFAEQLVVVKHH